MRIISGSARGRKIKAPEGQDTRPTSDRVKESLFNIILKYVIDSNVLDMFGGTGNLGLECLSRNAKKVTFIEKNKATYAVLKENINDLSFNNRAVTYNGDAFLTLDKLSTQGEKFDLIFLDPPYGKELVEKSIEKIAKCNILSEDGMIITEYDAVDNVPEKIGEFEIYRTQKYGRTKISLWRKEEVNE